MHFETLEVGHVGRWADRKFQLVPGLNLFIGDNEAGKSTLRRALVALLFDTDRSAFGDLVAPLRPTDFDASAIVVSGGERVSIRRRGTRLEADRSVYERIVAPGSRAAFTTLFAIGHEELREGGDSLLAEGGEIGRILLGARTGLRELTAIGDGLAEELRERVSGSQKSRLKVGLAAWNEALEHRKNTAKFDTLRGLELRLAEARQRHASAEQALREHDRVVGVVKADRQVLPDLAEWRRVRAEIEALRAAGASDDANTVQAIRDAVKEEERLVPVLAERVAAATQARAVLEAVGEASPVLAQAAAIDALEARLSGHRASAKTVSTKRAELADLERQLAERLRRLGFDVGGDVARTTADALGLDASAVVVAEAHARLVKLEAEGERLTLEVDEATRALASGPAVGEERVAALEGLLERMRSFAETVKHLATLTTERQAVDKERLRSLKALGCGGLDTCPVTESERVIRQRWKQRETAREAAEAADEGRSEAAVAVEETERKVGKLRRIAKELVSEEALVAARRERDETFGALAAKWDAKKAGTYGTLVTGADRLADRRYENAERAHELDAAARELEEARLASKAAADRADAARTASDSAEKAWNSIFAAIEEAPDDPDEWLRTRKDWQAAVDRLTALDAELAASERERVATEPTLAGELTTLLGRDAGRPAGWVTLVERAVTDEAKRAGARKNAESTLAKSKRELERVANERRERLAEWSRSIAARLPKGITTTLEGAKAWLEARDWLSGRSILHGHATSELEAAERAIERFEQDVGAVVSALGRTSDDAARSVELLAVELKSARAVEERRRVASAAVATAEREEERARAGVEKVRAALAVRASAAGVEVAAFPAYVARSSTLVQQVQALATTEHGFAARRGRSIAEVARELEGRDDAAFERELAGLAQQRESLEMSTQEAFRALLAVEQDKQARLREGGVDPAQEAADAEASLANLLEDVLLRRAAKVLLDAAVAKAREDDTLTRRGSELFARLTDGAWSGLSVRDDEAGSALFAIDGAGESFAVDELSDGTRDQVWFALRLAGIEAAAVSAPLPLVLDDVFVHFDERRTRAALQVLAELAGRHQVLVFTHHDHVVQLAEGAISGRFRAHSLDRVVPSSARAPVERGIVAAAEVATNRNDTSASEVESEIVAVLREAGIPLGKSEIVDRLGPGADTRWNAAIKSLKDAGTVVQDGEKRGAKYRLTAAVTNS